MEKTEQTFYCEKKRIFQAPAIFRLLRSLQDAALAGALFSALKRAVETLRSIARTQSIVHRFCHFFTQGAREQADDVLLFHRNKRTSEQSGLCSDVVRAWGLEPQRIAAREPKSRMSTNSIMPANMNAGTSCRCL